MKTFMFAYVSKTFIKRRNKPIRYKNINILLSNYKPRNKFVLWVMASS